MICLDTNAVIPLLEELSTPLHKRFKTAVRTGETIAVSSIVLFELQYGAARSGRPERNARRIVDFLSLPVAVLPFDTEDADEAGSIRAALERSGLPIGPYDVLIAAQARRRDALLVTANTREFARVPGLRTEDWSE